MDEVNDSTNTVGTSYNFVFNSYFQSNKWIVDLGANEHITSSESNQNDVVNVSNINLIMDNPNGSTAKFYKIRNMNPSSKFTLFDVFVIREFNVNMLSVHKLCNDSKCKILFDEYNYIVHNS